MAPVAPEPCCPLCKRAWAPPEGLTIANGRVYWKGELVKWGSDHSRVRGGATTKLFIHLVQHAGKELRVFDLIQEAYGIRLDGGPSTNNFRVVISKIRRGIERYGIPIRIDTNSGHYLGGGTLSLHFIMEPP